MSHSTKNSNHTLYIRAAVLASVLIFGAFLFIPKSSLAKTFTYQTQSFDVDSVLTKDSQNTIGRQVDLLSLARHQLLQQSYSQTVAVPAAQTQTQIAAIEQAVNHPMQNARLSIKDNWATTFVPNQDGLTLDTFALINELPENSDGQLPLVTSKPEVTLADLNNLGITELVATGESDFTGSTANRLTNIKVGAAKYNGLIVAPGAEFSFNQILGDVDAAHGFKPELVIKASGVVPEFGGGLCQVSTTVFRAAMNAGFPVTERRNHSFAVKFYAPQGTDATIYPGVSDFKFVNNMAGNILIWTRIEGNKLYFDIYGTKDDRQVTFEGPYTYDRKSNGALKAVWTRDVIIDGQKTEQVFNSNYLPPSEFEGSEKEVSSTPNPQATPTPANNPVPAT
ncbi:MAG TPA: VanW family protein [Patescibacteria group bacterium]|nr:VanW family protein [Patescibacteria group bacterium]